MTQRISWQAAEEREGNPVQNFLLDAGEKLGFGKKALAPWEVDPESGTNVLGDTITYQGKNKEQYNSEANQAALRTAHAANRNLVGEASVKLDTDSGKVTVTAPKGVMESEDFKKAINTDVLKQASQAYRTNKDYKLPYNEYNTETGKLEEKEITVPEYIEKINESLKSIANNMLTADAYRSGYSSQWNKKADDITESQIRMSIDYKGDYIPIPHFITRLDSFRGTGIEQYIKDGYIKKEDLKKFYNRDKLGRDELAVIMGTLENGLQHGTWNQDEYYQDEDGNDVFDTYNANEMARAIAFRNYMLENDPEQNWLQSVWSNVETAYVNFSAGATSVVTNIANMGEWAFTGGQGHAVQDYIGEMDTAMDKYNEQNKLVNDATAATAWLSYIGGVIAGTWATGKVAKWGISGLSKGASAIGDATIGKSVEATMAKAGIEAGSAASQALTAKTMIQLASQAENVGRGALFAMRVSDFGFKLKMVTDVARAFMLNHSTLNTAVSFLLDTLHDAILYDSTTLRGVLESSDQDTKDYWMGQLAENGKWWMGMAGARGLIKNAGKTSIGKWADAHISKYINQKAASVGDKWASIKDKLAGGSLQDKLQKELDDLLDEGKASKARKAKKIQNKLEQLQFNQQLRSARREFGNLKIERENWHTLKLSDKTARELAAKKNAVRALDISIDAYNRNIQYKRQEMLGVIPRDPYTGLKNLYINPGLGGSNAKTSEFYFKLAKMNEAAGLGRVDNSFLSQDVIDYLMGSYDFRRYSNLSAPGAAEAAENAKINIDALREKLPDNIVKFIDDNAGIYTEFYDELNKYAISHRLLDRKRINGYKNETWDRIGGYQPVIVAQDTAKGVRRSIDTGGEVAATIDQEMRELTYQVKVGQHYIDPELTRQSRISRIAQAEINRNMLDNYMRNTGASFSEHVTGTETEFVREVKQGRKTLEKALADRSENFVQDFNVRIRRRALEAAEDATDSAKETLTADQIKKAYDLKEPVAPKKPDLKATDDQIKKWIGESFSPDVHINLVEDFLGRPILDIAEEDFDSFIKGLDSNSKKVIRDAIRQNSKTASTAYSGAAQSTGEITRAQAIKNLKIKTSSYREATGLGYKDAPDWIKPLLSEKNGETLDIIGRRVFGDKMTAAGGNTTLDIDDTLEELERIMGRRTNAKGTLDWVSWEELVSGGNYEVLEDLKANLAKSMVENDYRGIWNYKNESDPEAVPIREWGIEAVNEGPLNEYYDALEKYEAELEEYNIAKGKMEAEIAEMQDVVSGKVDEMKEYTPYKNKVIKSSVREKVVAELTFDDTTDALYAMDILGNDRPLMTSGVDEENYWDWYNSLNKKAQVYVNEQTMEYGKSGYASLRMAVLAGGQDFEYGLRRAYLLGDADFAKSGIMNEAARRLERGQDALMDGVYALKAKNELRKIMDVDTDRFVDDLMITYKKAVNTYIDKMTRSVGVRMASNTMSFHMVASDTEIEHMVLSQLKSKHRGDIMESIRKEIDAITDGKSLSKDDVKKLTAQAEELFDEYLDSRIATDAHAIKAAGGSAVDSKAAYEEVKRLDEEIRGAKEAVNQNNTGMIMYVDGQGRQAYATVDPAFASLYNRRYRIDGADASAMAKINAVMSKTFRYGTTSVNLSSFGNQLFRDFGNAVMVGGSWKTIKSYADEMRDVFGSKIVEQIKAFDPDGYEIKQLELLAAQMGKDINTAAVSRELMRGAAIAPSSTERTLYKDLWKNLKNDSNIKIDQMDKKAKQILDKYNPDELLNGKRENYLRNRVYAANLDDGLKNGYSLRDSRILAEFTMNNATTNFGRQLYHLQSIAESTPYFRAAINGTKSFWRMWMLDPVGISGRITGGLILPTMYLVGASLGDKESKEIYKNIPEYQKQESLVFVMNGEILSIPMPQELSSVVAPFRQFVEYLNDSQPNDFWELMTNDLLSYLPVDLTGYTAIDMNTMSADPTVLDRLGRGTSRVFSQLAPVPVKTTYILTTGIDPYTGKNMNDPSYWYWDEENGSLELMDYTQNRFAKAIADTGFLGKNATVWEKVFSGIFGKTSTDVLDDIFEMFMEGPDAGFNAAGENFTKALTNPFTVEQYDLVDRYWKDAVKSLTAEKNAILQDPRVQKLNSELAQTKDTEKRKKILAERSEFTDDFYKKVDETARRLTNEFKGTFDRYKFAAVIQLLNFNTEPGWQSGTQESSDEASGAFYTGRDAALQMMSQMGIESSDDLSVFGYVAKDKNGNMVMKYNTPSTILDMKNNQMGQSNFHLSNIKSMVSQAGLYDKHDSVSKQISAIYDKAKKTNSDYQTIEAIQINWNAEVAKVLADYIDKYSAEAAINNKQVRDYLKSYIEVPASWEKNNKGKRVYGKTLGDRGSLKDAYYSSWLKTMFGINDPYKGQY